MNLQDLVNKLGLKEVARRLGIKESTLKKWLRTEPSNKGLRKILEVIANHLKAVKSATTKKKKKKIIADFPIPEEIEDEDPADVVPESYPPKDRIQEGTHTSQNENTKGETTWVRIGKTIQELNIDELADIAIEIWEASSRKFCQIKFLIYRFISKTSSRAAKNKLGTWVEQWGQTKVSNTAETIKNTVADYILGGPTDWSLRRTIFLEMMGVKCFNYTKSGTERFLDIKL